MESGNGGASSKGVFIPLSASSDAFHSNVLAPLKSAYLYEESKQLFSYESAALVNNPALEKKYKDFRAKRRELGYSEEELKESYGFLLFEDVIKANALGETGVLTGNSTCTALGDPSNGVYISVFSDCLDLNRWYHEKSGYIAIIRLTKGRVKKVSENYTQNFTAPTEGFDCHVSEELHSVSAKTSSFVAFERAQYYMYELLDDGSNETAQSPSAACPFAIVSFTYKDTKGCQTPVTPHEKSEEKKLVYFPWRGQLQIGTLLYGVGLRSTAGASIPAELPPVVKIHGAISMLELRQLLPRAVFETCFSGEVFLDGFYCSLYEFVSTETEQTNSLPQLLWEIKEKDVALTIPLNDGGFLILLHSSHFLTYDDTGSSAAEVLQGMFVFSDSRVIHGDIKLGQRNPAISSEILRALPVLSYAEGEVEKTPADPNEELCEVFVQHMQSYAALINPGLALSPSRDTSIFPDQYDVPDADKHLYLFPEWTDRAWQNFRSYLSKPVSFQLPVSKASEILAAGQEEQIEDLDYGVYFCLSSPEDAPDSHAGVGSEGQLTGQTAAENVEAAMDHCITSAEAQVDFTAVPQNIAPDDLRPGDVTKDTEKSELTVLIKTDDIRTRNLLTTCTADNLPTEMIVSITSAERTVTDGSLSVISTESATKHIDFKLSGFSAARLQMAGLNSMSDETDETKKVFNCPEVTNLSKTKHRKLRRGRSKGQKHAPKVCVETPVPVEDDDLSLQEDQSKDSTGHPQLSNPTNIDWRKVRRRKRKFGTLSSKNKKMRSATVGVPVMEEKKADPGQQNFEGTILMEIEACPLRKKTERWDLKPVTSECGRILVPHGSIDIADQIKNLKVKVPLTKDEPCPEKLLVDATVNAHDTVEMQQESSTAPETTVDEPEVTTSEGEGNHPQNVVSNVNHEHIILRPSDGNGSLTLNPESTEHSSKDDSTDTPPLKTFQEKHMDTPSPRNCATKGEFLLNKLKSVLLMGNRKTGTLGSEKMTADTAHNTEPCLKKAKVDSDFGMLKTDDAVNFLQDTSLGVKEVSNMLSVDPLFAHALGLTPKETGDKIQKSEIQDTQQRKDSSGTEEQNSLDKQPQITRRPLSIFPRRGRIKTLKKHQGISAEYVKRNWWLHFQTPACLASEKLNYKECTRDKSVRKTVKEKSNSACSSTDALNLLADLALSASNDQVLPQPGPAPQRKPETSLKNCDITKDVTTVEQESVLHALLRQPTTRPIQPLESPSPSHLVGGSELVGLIAKEHAYSFHPSSSLLLDLSGTPFQVPPLSGSTRLLHHHQTMSGRTKTPHPSVIQEDRREQNHRTPEYLKKRMVCSRKFRHSRTFVNKDGSVQVTKQCKGNYDFNLDSKFTSDSKDRAIIRALHGPWNFSIQDTSEEVQLIVHMWIGLFYSRSTARFFHVDSDCTYPSPEESDSLEMSTGVIPAPAQSELKANSSAPCLNVTDTSDKALDLSKKDNFVLDQGSVILDLSQRNSNAEIVTSGSQVNREETSVSGEQKDTSDTLKTLKSSVELQTASTFQCYTNGVDCTEIVREVNDIRSTYESKRTCTPLEKAGPPEHTDVPSFKDLISVQEEVQSVSVQLESPQTASGMCHVSHECNNEKTDIKDGVDHSEATEIKLMQKQGRDSSKEVDSNKKAANVVHTIEHDESESQNGEDWKLKEKQYREGHMDFSPKDFHTDDNSTNEESHIVYNGNLVDNVTQVSREEPEAVSPVMAENVNDNMDCCVVCDDKVIKDDHFGKEDGRDETDCYISHVEADSDLNDQPLPILCDDPDSVTRDSNAECNGQAPLDEQASQANKDACHDLQLGQLSANGCVLTDEHSISETVPHASSEMEHVHDEPAVEGNSENSILGADLSNQPFLTYDGPDSIQKDCITECDLQAPLDEQPHQADNKEDACCDLQLRDVGANGSGVTDDRAFSETATHLSLEMDPTYNEPVIEENSENYICLADKAHYQKAALDVSIPQTNDSVETGSQNKVMSNLNLRSDEHEDQDTRSIEGEQNVDVTSQKELFYHQSHSPLFETVTRCESEMTLTKGADIKSDETNRGLEKIHHPVIIPFIGLEPSGEARDSHSQAKVEEVQGQKEIFSSETTYPEIVLPSEVCSTSHVYNKKAELCAGTLSLSLFDVNETEQPEISGSESDDRSPTPTMDEEPYQYVTCSDPVSSTSSSTFKDSEPFKNMTKTCLSRGSVLTKDEMPLERKHKPSVDSDPDPHHGLHPDLELKTKKVLQSIDKFLSKSSQNGTSSQMKTADTKHFLDQTDKLQETSIGQDCHLHSLFASTECLQIIESNIDQDKHKSAKNDEILTDCISKDRVIEDSVLSHLSKNKQTTSPVITYNKPASMLLEKKTGSLKGIFGGLSYDKQEASELSPKSTWLSGVSDSMCNSSKAKFACQDSLYQSKETDVSESNKIPPSLPIQSFESIKNEVDGSHSLLTNSLVENIGQTTKEIVEMDQTDCSNASTSIGDYKDDSMIDDRPFLEPQSSLTCTVYNISQRRSESFLEQLSKRCLQDDLTQASMEQECLIFSEQMKQLLKRSKRGPIHQLDTHDKLNLSCSSPVTIHFSSLKEQDDSVDHLDMLSFVGQKIKVDMFDRKDLSDTTGEESSLHLQKLPQRNPLEHAGVSSVTAECARLYTAMMNDVCVVKKVPSRPKHSRMELLSYSSYSKTAPSNHFDFCDQMTREIDESNLNSTVKKSCKTKYRFYILVTSDDTFFEETKAQLEAEGHTAVQPSEFFLNEDSSSSLFIILRNEDIAQHICEVPHLLDLKQSAGVQFAGIDEPDDIVNLTHQELFMRGGFVMVDRAAQESLSLCNMKEMSKILQELSRKGKWKWMLHYRDIRRLKENARLSEDAKEKRNFFNWCQEVGILDVLPYHKCDLMSRDQPDYLTCLVHLQVQNISARYHIFITDTTADEAFGKKGILTMTLNSFLTSSPSKTFSV
ncbi:protein TASOR 2 [Chaetodon trifascialis]|uniref:protein TASOR 2 n=1 Tax=Chaetodon trifascialis TaxID=109706 RepID=UPI00399430C5